MNKVKNKMTYELMSFCWKILKLTFSRRCDCERTKNKNMQGKRSAVCDDWRLRHDTDTYRRWPGGWETSGLGGEERQGRRGSREEGAWSLDTEDMLETMDCQWRECFINWIKDYINIIQWDTRQNSIHQEGIICTKKYTVIMY